MSDSLIELRAVVYHRIVEQLENIAEEKGIPAIAVF